MTDEKGRIRRDLEKVNRGGVMVVGIIIIAVIAVVIAAMLEQDDTKKNSKRLKTFRTSCNSGNLQKREKGDYRNISLSNRNLKS